MSKIQHNTSAGETYWDKHGIPRLTLSETLWQIEVSVKAKQNRGVWCLIAEAGEGKSQGINALLRRLGYRVCDIRTAQLTHVGAGVPTRPENGFFEYALPADMPRPGEKAALVFDEYNQGLPHAMALAFKLLEDRAIYGYTIPEDCPIILIMNPSTAGYQVSKIEGNPALNRRVKKIYVYTTFAEWKAHAQTEAFHFSDGLEKPCHPAVVRFLTSSPELLYTAKDRDSQKQFCCPATWQTVSLDLYNMEAVKEPLTSARTENRIAATINTINAQALIEWMRNNELIVSPIDILTKYTRNSALRTRVLEMQHEPGGGFPRLVEAVATYLFADKPEPALVAPRLLLFWSDMPSEQAQAFYQQLAAASSAGGAESTKENHAYMMSLTLTLQADPAWNALNERLESELQSVTRDLARTGTDSGMPDPMAS